MTYKKIRFFVLLVLLMAAGTALGALDQNPSDQALLARVDSLVSYFDADFSAFLVMVESFITGGYSW